MTRVILAENQRSNLTISYFRNWLNRVTFQGIRHKILCQIFVKSLKEFQVKFPVKRVALSRSALRILKIRLNHMLHMTHLSVNYWVTRVSKLCLIPPLRKNVVWIFSLSVSKHQIKSNKNLKCVISLLNIRILNYQIHIQKSFLDFVLYVKVIIKVTMIKLNLNYYWCVMTYYKFIAQQ